MSTLIVYGSKSGSTAKAAHLLKDLIPEAVVADLTKNYPDPHEYDNIILGSAIRIGQIQKEAKKFLTENSELLEKKNLGLFICCGLMEKTQEQLENNFSDELRAKALAVAGFGGEMNPDNLKGVSKIIAKTVIKKRSKDPDAPKTEFKNEIIREFAKKFN